MIEDAGFLKVDYQNLNSGIVAIHSGFKLWVYHVAKHRKCNFLEEYEGWGISMLSRLKKSFKNLCNRYLLSSHPEQHWLPFFAHETCRWSDSCHIPYICTSLQVQCKGRGRNWTMLTNEATSVTRNRLTGLQIRSLLFFTKLQGGYHTSEK